MGLSELTATLLTAGNGIIMLSSSALIQAMHRLFPDLCGRAWFVRVRPLLPILVCSIFVWLPGARPPEEIGTRIMVGIILGTFAASVYKTVSQTVMGKDKRIKKGGLV